MVGLRSDAGAFFGFLLVVFLATQAAESVAYIVSALASTPQQAGASTCILALLLSGKARGAINPTGSVCGAIV
jgi:hypothetical protein